MAAAGLIGAATAIAVDQWRKRKQSEVDQQVDAAIQAAAFNAQQHPKGLEYEIPKEDRAGKDDGVGGSKDKSGQGKKGALPASSEPLKDKSTTSDSGKEPASSLLQQGTNWLQTHVLTPAGNWINQHIPITQPATKTDKLGGQQSAVDKKGNSPLKNAAIVGATLFGIGAAGYLAWPAIELWICGPGAKLNLFPGMSFGVLPLTALVVSNRGKRARGALLGLLAMLMILSACGPAPTPTPGTPTPPDSTSTALATPCTPTVTLEPTPTQLPWLSPVSNADGFNSNWGFIDENRFNVAILSAVNSAGGTSQIVPPPWILKGVIAAESSFNPIARSPTNGYGLTQVTGAGLDALWKFGDPSIAISDIRRAWSLLPPAKAQTFPNSPPATDADVIRWYWSLTDDNSWDLRDYALNTINGRCDYVNLVLEEGGCTFDGELSLVEVDQNLLYGTMILSISYSEMETEYTRAGGNWSELDLEDRWRIAITNYNLSVGSGSSSSVALAFQACHPDLSWACVSVQLDRAGLSYAPDYADRALDFAQQGDSR